MKPVMDRLREKVRVDPQTTCHEFTGALTAAGYGLIGLGRRGEGGGYTHRLMYEHHNGPIPPGMHIDHLCSNRSCCNPAHLEAVTQAENNRRASARKMARKSAA